MNIQKNQEYIVEIIDNGFEGEGTYSIEDTKLKIKLKSWDEEKVYEFKLEGDKLSLTPTDPYSPKYPELIKK